MTLPPHGGAIAGVLLAVVALVAIALVILHKRDVRAAIGWTGLIALSPFFGAAAYCLFGINRIRRRAGAEIRWCLPLDTPSFSQPAPVGRFVLGRWLWHSR